MPNFAVSLVRNDLHSDGVSFNFAGMQKEKLIIKNIRYESNNHSKEVSVIHPVFLGEKTDNVFFEFPEADTTYSKLHFQIKQENEIGWDVDVDLLTHKIVIEQAKYQVM